MKEIIRKQHQTAKVEMFFKCNIPPKRLHAIIHLAVLDINKRQHDISVHLTLILQSHTNI